jgi:hypothetical protein
LKGEDIAIFQKIRIVNNSSFNLILYCVIFECPNFLVMTGKIRAFRKGMLLLLVVAWYYAGTQAQEISKFDLEQRAEHFFQQQRYDKATADYEVLYDMYPKDARYAYFLGRSYLHSNRYLDKAAELLKFSATRNYGDDAYFYLGMAHHLNYNFEDAALAFITFQKTASGTTLKKFDTDYWIALTSNARQSVEIAQDLDIENMKVVPAHSIESAFSENSKGKYIYVPDEFKSAEDKESEYSSLMFFPNQIEIGDQVFYSSHSKGDRQGSQIYSVQRISEKDFSMPKPLSDVINTSYDEAYPYFDKLSSTLYFSSKGHNTSGGYDIFKSKYNSGTGIWDIPEKLVFPINSVHDDFMYTLQDNENGIMFATNRDNDLSEIEVYTVNIMNPGEYISTKDRDQITTLALLSPSSITIDEPLMAQKDKDPVSVIQNPVGKTETSSAGTYASHIEEALMLQGMSDSLASAAQSLRIKVRDVNNYQQKQDLVASITTLDKESKRLQQEADAKFQLADNLRQPKNQDKSSDNKKKLTRQDNSSGLTMYTYDKPAAPAEVAKSDPGNQDNYNRGYNAAKEMGNELTSAFSIMSTSPYSKGNPIPVASLPGGLIYRIQLGSYSQEIPENTFGGLSPVTKENASNITRYYVGTFNSIINAREALDKVKAYGYPDAFLVSFYNQNKISVQEAREIEFANR